MRTDMRKITLEWILETFDFFFFMIFSLLMWVIVYFFLLLFGINIPRNSDVHKSKNNEPISKNQEPKEIKFKFEVNKYSNR